MPSLFTEIASIKNGRDITRGFVNAIGNLLPTQDSLLTLKSGGDLRLYEEVAQDDRVKTSLQQRFRALIAKDWEVRPGGDKRLDKKAAEDLEQQLKNIAWDDINEMMLWGVFYGYSAAEMLWGRDGDRIIISDIRVRNRRRFVFNDSQQLCLQTFESPLGELLPERKFWTFRCGADNSDEPYGRGLAHWLYWLTFFKRNDLRWWIRFLELFAHPSRKGKYPAGTSAADKEILWQAMSAFGQDDKMMIPEGLDIEFLEASRSGTADYKELHEQVNSAITMVILSQTMTTDNGSSLSQAQVHENVADDIVKADADLICGSFNNSVARWLTDWNYPGAAYPQVWRKVEAEPDLKAVADRDAVLVGMGFNPTPEYIVETYGEGFALPEQPKEPPLSAAQVPAFTALLAQAQQGGWSADTLKAAMKIAFPLVGEEQVNALASGLEKQAQEQKAQNQTQEANNPQPQDTQNTSTDTPQDNTQPPTLDDIASMFWAAEFKMQEGTTKVKNGVTYVLTNSRWKRQEPKPKSTKSKKTPLSEDAKKVVEKVKESSGVKSEPKAEEKPDLAKEQKKAAQNEKSKKELDRLVAGIDKATDKRLQMEKIYQEFYKTGIDNADNLVNKIKVSSQYSGLSSSSVGIDTQDTDNLKREIAKALKITNGIGAKNLKEVTIEGYKSSSDLTAGKINAATNPLTGSNQSLSVNNRQAFSKEFAKFVEQESGAKSGSLSGLGNFLSGADEMLDLYQRDRAQFDAALNFLKESRGWKKPNEKPAPVADTKAQKKPESTKKQPKAKAQKPEPATEAKPAEVKKEANSKVKKTKSESKPKSKSQPSDTEVDTKEAEGKVKTKSEPNSTEREALKPQFRGLLDMANGSNPNSIEVSEADIDRAMKNFIKPDEWVEPKSAKVRKDSQEVTKEEAYALATWVGEKYRPMNAVLYGGDLDESVDRQAVETTTILAAKALHKLPSVTKKQIAARAKQKGYTKEQIEDETNQPLGRYLAIENPEEFIKPYQEALKGDGTIRESTHFATTHISREKFAFANENTTVTYKVNARLDGKGKGKYIDHYKNGMFEGEVLYPPQTKFRVVAVTPPDPIDARAMLSPEEREVLDIKEALKISKKQAWENTGKPNSYKTKKFQTEHAKIFKDLTGKELPSEEEQNKIAFKALQATENLVHHESGLYERNNWIIHLEEI